MHQLRILCQCATGAVSGVREANLDQSLAIYPCVPKLQDWLSAVACGLVYIIYGHGHGHMSHIAVSLSLYHYRLCHADAAYADADAHA